MEEAEFAAAAAAAEGFEDKNAKYVGNRRVFGENTIDVGPVRPVDDDIMTMNWAQVEIKV
jgi:hypothetical protein